MVLKPDHRIRKLRRVLREDGRELDRLRVALRGVKASIRRDKKALAALQGPNVRRVRR